MRKLIVCLAALSIIACKKGDPKNYATFSGKIENKNSDSLYVYQPESGYKKTIKVNKNGTFSDTLHVKPGFYGLYDGKEQTGIYLENSVNLKMTFNAKNYTESLKFSGEGVEKTELLANKIKFEKNLIDMEVLKNLSEPELDTELSRLKNDLITFYKKNSIKDTLIINDDMRNVEPMFKEIREYAMSSINMKKHLAKGTPSPTFNNLENHNGETSSLSDFKGKYVYVDLWATWCAPCLAELPALEKLQEEFKDKNIEFVSISLDDGRGYRSTSEKHAFVLSKVGWSKMVSDKNMRGTQLFSGKGFDIDFTSKYLVNYIPRFILIDPKGNIVNADAPKPSYSKINDYFKSVGI